MSTYPPIHNWTDGFVAIRERAINTRGLIALDDGPKWPRTTGDDVVLIAGLFDPSVRGNASAGLAKRWKTTLDTIERTALDTPHDTYSDNRNFWSTLELAAVTLDDQAAPVPPSESWRRLLQQLGAAPRNAQQRGDALAVFAAMGDTLRAQRGTLPDVELAGVPESGTPNAHTIPFLENADAIKLADFWTQWLDETPNTDGNGILLRSRWHDALDDVDAEARPGSPSARYGESAELWAACAAVAAYISAASKLSSPRNAKRSKRDDGAAEETPADDSATLDNDADETQLDDADTDDGADETQLDDAADSCAPPRDADALAVFLETGRELRAKRGTLAAATITVPHGSPLIPRLTNADATALVTFWRDWLAELPAADALDPPLAARWQAVRDDVDTFTAGARPSAEFGGYGVELWSVLAAIAGHISTVTEAAADRTRNAKRRTTKRRTRTRNAPGSTLAGWLASTTQRTDPLVVYTGFVQRFRAERGSYMLAPPPGYTGTTRQIPRTTNDDVLLLAAWCSDELAATPHVAGATGDEIKHWAAAVADVTALAWPGDPDAEYERNNEFWRALAAVVVLMSATDDVRFGRTPTQQPPRNGDLPDAPPFGPFDENVKTLDDIYRAQLANLRTQRDTDPGVGFGGATIAVPRTTNADVVQLADWWQSLYSDQKDHIADVVAKSGSPFDAAPWEAALADVNSIARTGDPSTVYSHNAEFWRRLGDLATATALGAELPPSRIYDWTHHTTLGQFALGLVHKAEDLPGEIADAAKAAGSAVKAYVWNEIKWPLAIGGGALGLYLLARHREESAA